jgi:hypothetical protein
LGPHDLASDEHSRGDGSDVVVFHIGGNLPGKPFDCRGLRCGADGCALAQ